MPNTQKAQPYSPTWIPDDYVCGTCGARNCKLWREAATFEPKLACASCISRMDGVNIMLLDDSGMLPTRVGACVVRTNFLGSWTPAIPDEREVGYWGIMSVPQQARNWWAKMPTLPKAA